MALDAAFLLSEHILIPFLFVLAIIFGILELTGVFRNRGVKLLISLSIAFFTVTNSAFVELLWSQFALISGFFIVMFFIAFVLQVFGIRGQAPTGGEGIMINGAILVLLLVFGFASSNLLPQIPFLGGGTNLISIAALILILVIFWAAFKTGEQPQAQQQGRK
jgi:hypothetical protein